MISCSKDDDINSTDRIVGTWGLYKEVNTGVTIVVNPENPDEQITYHSNGNWESASYNSNYKGIWRVTNEDTYILKTIGGGFITDASVEFLNDDEHILKISENVKWYYQRIY